MFCNMINRIRNFVVVEIFRISRKRFFKKLNWRVWKKSQQLRHFNAFIIWLFMLIYRDFLSWEYKRNQSQFRQRSSTAINSVYHQRTINRVCCAMRQRKIIENQVYLFFWFCLLTRAVEIYLENTCQMRFFSLNLLLFYVFLSYSCVLCSKFRRWIWDFNLFIQVFHL